MNKFYSTLLFFSIIFFSFKNAAVSQNNQQPNSIQAYKNLQLVAGDSLQGFDYSAKKTQAINEEFFGDEFYVFMYNNMREYINTKYNLIQNQNQNQGGGFGGKGGQGGNIINVAPCVNEDFELNNFSGWTVTSGVNSGNCIHTTPTIGSTEAWIRTTPWADPQFPGNVPNSPLGGTRIAQLNNNAVGNRITRISQTFPVTSGNALFQYAYCAVFNGAHSCCQRPFLKIDLLNCSNVVLACPQVSVIAPGGVGCGPASPGFTTVGAISKCLWQISSIDLTPYIGTCITIRVTVGDCSGGAHQGYCFFDARCMSMNYVINGNIFPAGTQATTVTACGAITATVSGPPGLAPYLWNGPVGSGVLNNPNQTFTTSMAGQYTLTLNPPGACSPTIKFVTITFAPNPTAGIVYSNMCNVFTFTNTGGPAPLVQTYSFTGPAPPPSFTTASTTTSVVFPTPGNYTVTQVVTTTAGCTATVQVPIIVPPAPDVNFTINNPVQCFTGNSFIFTATNPTGVHSYSFNPPVGAPPVGNTPTYGPVAFSLPGTYTVSHSVTAGGCTTYTTATVVINPQPTPTVGSNSPVCVNTPIYLTSSGGNSYAWSGPLAFTSGVQNPTINLASLGMNGPYTVTVTSLAGCSSTAVTNVTVYALQSPTITSNSPVCVGSVLSLTASGGANYSWNGPNAFTSNLTNPSINNVSLLAGGIYTLVAGSGNCTVSTSASITINPLPNTIAGSNSPVCLNQPLLLTAGGGTQYVWVGPNGYNIVAQNPTISVAQMTNNGVFTVTATDGNSCVQSATTNVVINPLPVLAVNNPSACVGANINFIAGGANAYSWTGPLGYSSPVQNPVIGNASLPMGGQYTLVGTSAVGCTNTAYSNVNVTPNPTAMIVSNSPVCDGGTLTLSGSGGATYSWSGPNGFTSANDNNTINNVTLPASGTYSLIVSVNTCTSLSTAAILINPLPSPAISLSSPVCFNEPITFTATGGATYAWSGPSGFVNFGPNPVIPVSNNSHSGVYTLIATDGNGCVNSTTASVIVKPLPLIVAVGSTVCLGWTASLTATSDGATYSWTGPNGFSSGQANSILPNFAANQAGEYFLIVTGANQCTAAAAVNVTNNPSPTPIASNNGPVCLNGEVKFESSGGLVYNWFGPNGFISNSQNTVLQSANSLNCSGTYTLGVIDDKGCQGFTTTNLIVRPLPTAKINTTANKFCVPFCSDFTASSTSSLQNLQWNTNNSGVAINTTYKSCFDKVGDYVIATKFVDQFGCPGSSSLVINAYPVPLADFHFGPGGAVENDEISFTDASLGAGINNWTWYFAANGQISFQQNPIYSFENPGTYPVALIIANKWGCKDTFVKPIVIGEGLGVFVPNAFTPNNDGLNDVFQPKGHGIKKYNMMIFDRWGEKLFYTDDFFKGWDGTFKGTLCKDDIYTWKIVVQGADGKLKELTGTVTIVR